MKKSIFNFLAIGSSLAILSSCYSPKFMVDDDVYVLKANEIPLGESMNDETSYSNFRENRRNGVNSQYSNDYYIVNNSFNNGWYGNNMMFGTNSWFRPSFAIFYNPYMGYSYDPYGYYYGYGYPYFGHYGYNYYDPYSYYGGNYGYYSPFFNPYFGPGSSWGNGGNGWNFGNGNSTVAYNHHNGPRGSITGGFGNPNRLESHSKVKSNVLSQPGGAKTPVRINNSDVVGRNSGGSKVTPSSRPVTTSGTLNPGRSSGTTTAVNNRSNERTLQPVENRGVISPSGSSYGRGSSGTISSGSNSGGRSGNFQNNSSGGRSTTINESRSGGSFNSGGSSSGSSSGGRSGGSSSGSSSSGRRP